MCDSLRIASYVWSTIRESVKLISLDGEYVRYSRELRSAAVRGGKSATRHKARKPAKFVRQNNKTH